MTEHAALDIRWKAHGDAGPWAEAVAAVIDRIATAAATLAGRIACAPVVAEPTRLASRNVSGDLQKAIDVEAHALFREAVRRAPVAAFLSEEAERVEIFDPAAPLCVAMDPLDGSANFDLNMPLGTIFSISKWPAGLVTDEDFVWPVGTEQLAAGFLLYGFQTTLVLTTDDGVDLFTLDPESRRFGLTRRGVRMPPAAPDEYAINASNYRHWDEPIRSHIDELVAGAAGPCGRDFNMRWHGALVAEAFRILDRGGLYLYPGDARAGYRNGRLRLIYEAYPIAFLAECAGGAACDGHRRILEIDAQSLHQHVPLIFGSKSMVDRLLALHHLPGLWPQSSPPLFAVRGLFRS